MRIKVSGVYCIFNNRTKSMYVGSTIDLHKRHIDHLAMLRNGRHDCKALQEAWEFDGEARFSFLLLEECNPIRLVLEQHEQFWLDAYPLIYNTIPYANRSVASKWIWKAHPEIARAGQQAPRTKLAVINQSPANRLAGRQRMLARWKDPNYRNRVSNSIPTEVRSETLKQCWKDPDYRARMVTAAKRRWENFRNRNAVTIK